MSDVDYDALGSVTPPTVLGGGIWNRFRYVAAYKGFVCMPSGTKNIYFIRTG